MSFTSFYQRSIDDPDHFWANEAKRITWHKDFSQTLDYSRAPFARWFLDGETNLCYNAVDRHLAQRAEQNALIAVSTETNTEKVYSFRELHREVSAMAAMMQGLGVRRGDRVLIYMPMIAEAVFAMLACARIGAVHSVVFGGFAPLELAKRIDDAAPRLLLAASCGIEGSRTIAYKPMVDEALRLADHPVDHVVLLQQMNSMLSCKSDHKVAVEFFRDVLDEHFSGPEVERQIETALNWGRYAEMFNYDSETDTLSLLQAADVDHLH